MGGCSLCRERSSSLLYNCNYFTGNYCSSHRLPENHNCPGLATATTLGPEFRRDYTIGDDAGREKLAKSQATPSVTNREQGNRWKWKPSTKSPDVAPDGSIIKQGTGMDRRSDEDESLPSTLKRLFRTVTDRLLYVALLPLSVTCNAWSKIRSITPFGIPNAFFLLVVVSSVLAFSGVYGTGYDPLDDAGETAIDSAKSGVGALDNATASRETNTTTIELAIHAEVNEERKSAGRSPLSFDHELQSVAYYHSERMGTEDFFSHTAPDGETMSDRYNRFRHHCEINTGGGMYSTGGENIAQTHVNRRVTGYGYISDEDDVAESVVDGWMNSPGHRSNLLDPKWRVQGIGVYVTDTREVYVTQNFC